MKWIIENAGKAISVLSFALLALTVFHDWGYYIVLGNRFQSIQTPYDFLSNAIDWLPWHGTMLVVAIGIPSPNVVQVTGDYPSGIRHKKAAKKLRNLLIVLLIAISVSLAGIPWVQLPTAFVLAGLAYNGAMLFAMLVWRIQTGRFSSLFHNLVFAAGLLPLSFSFGVLDAVVATKSSSNVYKIERKDEPTISVNLLRSLDKGLLLYDSSLRKVSLLRWDQVKEISHITKSENDPTIACTHLGLGCGRFVEP